MTGKIKIIRATTVPMSLNAFCKGMLKELSEKYEVVGLVDHPHYELLIYGEGPLKQELIDYCKKRGVSGPVKFMGHSNHVWEEI